MKARLVAALLTCGAILPACTPRESSVAGTNEIVVAITPFRTVGSEIDPWSGVGLAQQIQATLDTLAGWTARYADGGDQRGARYVLGGTVARRGARREIGVELSRLPDRTVIWTGTFWRTEADLASLKGELAGAVALAIRLDSTKPR